MKKWKLKKIYTMKKTIKNYNNKIDKITMMNRKNIKK